MIKIVLSIAFVAIACGKTVPGGYSQNPLLPPDLFIIGGDPAEPHAYPWQISLQVKRSGAWSHNCGGSIIDESTIVCAAHCVYGKTAGSMQVVAGAQFLSKDDDHSKQVRTDSELIAHKGYNPNTLGVNDISLIKLSEPLAFDEFVGPIKLPEQGENVADDTMCLNSGWGNTAQQGVHNPDELQVVAIPIIGQDECNELWNNALNDGNICAGGKNQGPCNGDSGGPLFCPNAADESILHGIVSWGHVPCGYEQYPGVYTRVSYFRDWIEENR